jgi:hypothetical protein
MGHAGHPPDVLPGSLEHDHVVRTGGLGLDRSGVAIHFAESEDPLVESEGSSGIPDRQTDMRQPVRLDHDLAEAPRA